MSEYQDNQYQQDATSNSSQSFYQAYMNQLARDRQSKHTHRGIVIYLTVITLLFLICFSLLAVIVVWHLQNPDANFLQNKTKTEQPAKEQLNPSMSVAEVAEKVNPSVVLINAAIGSSASNGTGFFLTANGYIATNYHVIQGAGKIVVTLYNGDKMDATLIGYRAEDDLAVIKIEGQNYPSVSIGNSDALKVGDDAIAIGNPGGADGGWTTTKGIISALNRTLSVEETAYFSEMKMLQTDAQVNPGNSGGPLCNVSGEVIGIVSRKISGYEGIGYAIPINEAMATLNAIIDGELDGFVSQVSKSRPKVGITGAEIAAGEKFTLENIEYAAPVPGFFVLEVSSDTGAYGIVKIGDIICAVNGVAISDLESFKNELYKCYVGQKVTFDLYRKGQKITVEIILGVS